MLLGVAIAQSQFDDLTISIHDGTVPILSLRLRQRTVYGEAGGTSQEARRIVGDGDDGL
jgi:hypothetical protein